MSFEFIQLLAFWCPCSAIFYWLHCNWMKFIRRRVQRRGKRSGRTHCQHNKRDGGRVIRPDATYSGFSLFIQAEKVVLCKSVLGGNKTDDAGFSCCSLQVVRMLRKRRGGNAGRFGGARCDFSAPFARCERNSSSFMCADKSTHRGTQDSRFEGRVHLHFPPPGENRCAPSGCDDGERLWLLDQEAVGARWNPTPPPLRRSKTKAPNRHR